MNLDFLDVLSQPNQKHREQVGTVGTPSSHANLSVPKTSPAIGNSGNNAFAPTAHANTCSHVFPVYSYSMGTEATKVDAAVPAVPGVPSKNEHFSNAETGVLAEQETTEKHIIRWIETRCARPPCVSGSEKSLYNDYRGWCRQNSLPPCSRELFSTALDMLFLRDLDGRKGLCLAADFEQAG